MTYEKFKALWSAIVDAAPSAAEQPAIANGMKPSTARKIIEATQRGELLTLTNLRAQGNVGR